MNGPWRLAGRYYWLVSAEDFVLQKLKVGRPRDFEDAVSVLERLGKALDRRYLERWARIRSGIFAVPSGASRISQ